MWTEESSSKPTQYNARVCGTDFAVSLLLCEPAAGQKIGVHMLACQCKSFLKCPANKCTTLT